MRVELPKGRCFLEVPNDDTSGLDVDVWLCDWLDSHQGDERNIETLWEEFDAKYRKHRYSLALMVSGPGGSNFGDPTVSKFYEIVDDIIADEPIDL